MTDTRAVFQLTNQILIQCKRKDKTSKTNYLTHSRHCVESLYQKCNTLYLHKFKYSRWSRCVCL